MLKRAIAVGVAALLVGDLTALAVVNRGGRESVVVAGSPRSDANADSPELPVTTEPATTVPPLVEVPSTIVARPRPSTTSQRKPAVHALEPVGRVSAPGLWLLAPDGSGVTHYADPLDDGGSSLIWAPGSKAIYLQRWFTDRQGTYSNSLVRQGVDGSRVTFPPGQTSNIMTASTDGRYLAEDQQSDTRVIDASTGTAVRRVNGYEPLFTSPTSLLTTNNGQLSRTDVTTGAVTTTADPLARSDRLFVGGGGQMAAVLSSGLAWRDVDGASHKVDMGGSTHSCDATVDLSRVECMVDNGPSADLVEVNLLTGTTRRIANAGPGTYAPDGRLAYAVAANPSLPFRRGIVVEQRDGSTATLMAAATAGGNELRPTTLDWSPDGSSIAALFWRLGYGY